MNACRGCLPPSPLCTQGLLAPMCVLRLLAAFLPCVSTPLWPISSIFITFCNTRSRVPNLKSALFPNVFVISTPRPSGCMFPNAELWLAGASREPSATLLVPEAFSYLLPALGAQPWAAEGYPVCQNLWPHCLLFLGTPGHLLISRLQGMLSIGNKHRASWLLSCASLHAQLPDKGRQSNRLLL